MRVPAPSHAGVLADDLERLITQAGLRTPLIVVAASMGGLTAEIFARRHPDRVAGLAFVDAGNSGIIERFAGDLSRPEIEAVCLVKPAARFGVLRLIDPFRLGEDKRLYRVESMSTICEAVRGFGTSAQELHAAPPLRADMPLTVLVHERPDGLLPPGLSGWALSLEREWLGLDVARRAGQRSPDRREPAARGRDRSAQDVEPRLIINRRL